MPTWHAWMSHTNLSSLDKHHQRIGLVQAITAGNSIITTRLVDAGANPGQRGKDGLTLLSRAVLFGREKLITELVKLGCDTEAYGEDGCTALQYAVGELMNATQPVPADIPEHLQKDAKSLKQESAKTSWVSFHDFTEGTPEIMFLANAEVDVHHLSCVLHPTTFMIQQMLLSVTKFPPTANVKDISPV